jgi:hypothetical protein
LDAFNGSARAKIWHLDNGYEAFGTDAVYGIVVALPQ